MARHAMRYRGTGRCGPDLGELSWQATAPTTTRWSKTLCSPLQLHSCSMPASRHWSAMVGRCRAPLNGHVLSELYQVHESALSFQRACPLDACLPALLQSSIGHENNLVDRVAVHIQAKQVQAPEAASIAAAFVRIHAVVMIRGSEVLAQFVCGSPELFFRSLKNCCSMGFMPLCDHRSTPCAIRTGCLIRARTCW